MTWSLYSTLHLFLTVPFEQYRFVLQRITGLYFVERYPLMLDASLSEADITDALRQIAGLLETIRNHFM